ncbi:sulfotransferase [bacterium]|nr:sulfotransferase [bacterium]
MKRTFMLKLLITGERRSGTTLLANFLNSQNHITIYRDFLHIERLQKNMGCVGFLQPLPLPTRQKLIQSFYEWTSMLEIRLELDAYQFSNLSEFYTTTLRKIAKPDDKIIGHKTTMAERILGDLLNALPDLKVIYILRDPRDLVNSALHRFADEEATLFDYIEAWQNSLDTILRLTCQPQIEPQLLIIRYEDFILNTGCSLTEISRFLGGHDIIIPDSMQDFGKRWTGNSSFGELNGPFDPSPVGRWKTQDMDVANTVEAILGNVMQKFGYLPELDLKGSDRLPDSK